MGGMVLETNITEIFHAVDDMNKLERESAKRPTVVKQQGGGFNNAGRGMGMGRGMVVGMG